MTSSEYTSKLPSVFYLHFCCSCYDIDYLEKVKSNFCDTHNYLPWINYLFRHIRVCPSTSIVNQFTVEVLVLFDSFWEIQLLSPSTCDPITVVYGTDLATFSFPCIVHGHIKITLPGYVLVYWFHICFATDCFISYMVWTHSSFSCIQVMMKPTWQSI